MHKFYSNPLIAIHFVLFSETKVFNDLIININPLYLWFIFMDLIDIQILWLD